MDRCPACRARFKAETCYRCGADLRPLVWMENRAQALTARGVRLLAADDRHGAETCLRQSLALHHRPLTAIVLRYVASRPYSDQSELVDLLDLSAQCECLPLDADNGEL